ncbi:MAG: hypothetical protein EOP68_21780, partial [Sphingomonas sp.]
MVRFTVSTIALACAMLGATAVSAQSKPTVAEADAYVAEAEKTLAADGVDAARIAWVNATYITDDTDALAAKSGAKSTDLAVKYALGRRQFGNPGAGEELLLDYGLHQRRLFPLIARTYALHFAQEVL